MSIFGNKSRNELRKFGFVMSVPLALIGGYLWWKGNGAFLYVLGTAGFFLVSALIVPRILGPIEFVWMKLALVMSAIMTRVILILAFFVVITPMGLLLRLMGKDLLDISPKNVRDSYWQAVERDGPASRADKPY